MKLNTLKIIFAFFFILFSFKRKPLDDLFLDIKLTDKNLYDKISHNKDFKMLTPVANYKVTKEFYAKYLKKSSLYINADSIKVHYEEVIDATGHQSNGYFQDVGDQIKIIEFIKDTNTIHLEYDRLLKVIHDAILATNPTWKNQPGASEGVFFLTQDFLHPMITIIKNTNKINFIAISIDNFEKKSKH